MVICSICNLFHGQDYASLLRHIAAVHRFDPGLSIHCNINGCPETYCNYESFRSHVYRKHRESLHVVDKTVHEYTDQCQAQDDSSGGDLEPDSDGDIVTIGVSPLNAQDYKILFTKFLLKTKEEYRICQATLNHNIVKDVQGLWETMLQGMQQTCENVLKELPQMRVPEMN